MSSSRIARVRWYLGQTLLPDHFRVQDEAQTAEWRLARRLGGLPDYGVARLEWNADLFAGGTVSLTALTCVFPGGALADLPGNATTAPLPLEETGKVRLPIYLHLTDTVTNAEGNRLYETDPKSIQRVIHRLVLSTEPAVDDMIDSLRLAEVERDVSGSWKLVDGYIPPLLTVGAHPFLKGHLNRLKDVLAWYEIRLRAQHVDSYASKERLGAVRRCHAAVTNLGSRLLDIEHGVDLLPYELFDGMRTLYREICCLDEMLPEADLPAYHHHELASSLDPLLRLIEQKVTPTADVSRHQPFVRNGEVFKIDPLPAEVPSAAECYLLVQRSSAGESVSLAGLKLASPTRLPLVQQLVLTGVPLKHLPVPTFPHPFGANIEFHRLIVNEEWEQVLREHALVFYAPPALQETKFALFWRNG